MHLTRLKSLFLLWKVRKSNLSTQHGMIKFWTFTLINSQKTNSSYKTSIVDRTIFPGRLTCWHPKSQHDYLETGLSDRWPRWNAVIRVRGPNPRRGGLRRCATEHLSLLHSHTRRRPKEILRASLETNQDSPWAGTPDLHKQFWIQQIMMFKSLTLCCFVMAAQADKHSNV